MIATYSKKSTVQTFLSRNKGLIKYGLFFANIIGMIAAVRMYINYSYISLAIEEEKIQALSLQSQIAYLENFHKPYLQSEFAAYFLGHENNRIFDGERIVQITQQETIQAETNETPKKIQEKGLTPAQQRKLLIREKIEAIE